MIRGVCADSLSVVNAFVREWREADADSDYLKAGAEYLQTAKSNPAFARIDTWLLRALPGMPKLDLPAHSKEKKPRIFEVRTYESYSEAKAQKKVDMFNNGEIENHARTCNSVRSFSARR
jgi:hypothetical protein